MFTFNDRKIFPNEYLFDMYECHVFLFLYFNLSIFNSKHYSRFISRAIHKLRFRSLIQTIRVVELYLNKYRCIVLEIVGSISVVSFIFFRSITDVNFISSKYFSCLVLFSCVLPHIHILMFSFLGLAIH